MISVVIPAYNAEGTLDECLRAIGRSDYADHEVIVVDDASTDASGDIARRHGCRIVSMKENVGAAMAKNAGARNARGDTVLFTDADVLLRPNTLRIVAEILDDATAVAVVGLLGTELRYQNFASQFKNLWMHFTYARLAASTDVEQGVGLFYTSIAAIRRDVFLRMQGFDSNYRGASVTEDIEFGQRLLSAGLKVRLDRRLVVEHLKYYSLRGLLGTDLKRAFGLTKTWLRKVLEPDQRAQSQKYYASVPWYFVLGVPLAWLLPVLIFLGLWTGRPVWWLLALADYGALLLANVPFLNALWKARGLLFLLQGSLFLPADLWVSGLGVLWATIDYMRGERY